MGENSQSEQELQEEREWLEMTREEKTVRKQRGKKKYVHGGEYSSVLTTKDLAP